MKKIVLVFFVLVALMGTQSRAWADIDHICLNQCVSAGNNTAACMPRCTYGLPDKPAAPATKSMPHGVFSSLTPTNGAVIVKPKTPAAPPASKDYTCFNQCLQQHNAYQLCEQQCTKTPCVAGSISCNDLTGVVNGAAAPAH